MFINRNLHRKAGGQQQTYLRLVVPGTRLFCVVPYIWNNHPNWLTILRGIGIPPTKSQMRRKCCWNIYLDLPQKNVKHVGTCSIMFHTWSTVVLLLVCHGCLAQTYWDNSLVSRWVHQRVHNICHVATEDPPLIDEKHLCLVESISCHNRFAESMLC